MAEPMPSTPAPPPAPVTKPPAEGPMSSFTIRVLAAAAAAVILGLVALATSVALTRRSPGPPPITRTYHIAVEEVAWRYAPSGYDNCSGQSIPLSTHAHVFAQPDATTGLIGDTYWRRRYVSYEPDGTFTKPRAGDWWAHAGIQGPSLRASVGEVLRVRLLNRGRFPASLHVHGLPLESATRGAAAADASPASPFSLLDAVLTFFSPPALAATRGASSMDTGGAPSEPFSSGARTSECAGADCAAATAASSLVVAPGEVLEYSWVLGEEAGPEGSAGSVGRLYSELTYDGHVDAGLAGVLVVTPRGADASRPPADAVSEVLALFSVSMESASPYLPLNILDFVWRARVAEAVAGAPAAAAASAAVARLATPPSSPHMPVPTAVKPAALLAALYNAAAAGAAPPITEKNFAVLAALSALGPGQVLAPGQTLVLPAVLLGVRLGSAGATLRNASALGAAAAPFYLLNATAFAALHSQRTLEGAVAPLAQAALMAELEAKGKVGDFEESNTMHGLNGLLYCNQGALPGAALPRVVLGANTRWYVAVLGTEVDLHAAHWHGNTVLERAARGAAYRSDSIALLPRQIATADMTAHAPGRWLFHCHVTDHIEAGMLGVYDAVAAGGSSVSAWLPGAAAAPPPALATQLQGRLREYFIQAEVGNWSYLRGAVGSAAAGGESSAALAGGAAAPPCGTLDYAALDATYASNFSWTKARFVRYTDATFSTRWVPPSEDEAARWAHLALLGPLLRGEVGDTLRVTFRNAAPVAFSMHPHGVLYAKGSEGAPYADATAARADTGDDMVQPGETWPYTWFLPDISGPGPSDATSMPWLYHGHVHEAKDEHTGLLGVLVVTARGAARVPGSPREEDLRPAGVDRELVVMAKVFSEGAASEEVNAHGHFKGRHPTAATDFFTLNGLIACRLALPAVAGERVRLYGVSLGNEIDLHTLGLSGHALSFRARQQSGLSLLPGTMYSADTVAAPGGGWLLGSSVLSHAELGMVARFDVAGGAAPAPAPAPGATVRQYFIAAAEVEWDYAPAGMDLCVSEAFKAAAGDLFPGLEGDERMDMDGTDLQGFPASVRTFVARSGAHLGRRYRKARYLGFSSAAFSAPLVDAHGSSTGLLGPALRAAAGDVLRVVLRNNLTFPVNLAFPAAPLLLLQLRERRVGSSAWAAVAGTPAQLAARGVPAGWEAEASWSVPAAAGPGPADPATIAWAYTSALSPDHLYAGLAGGLIVGGSGGALAPGSAAHGAAREYLVAWFISNENRSPFLEHNIAAHAPSPADVQRGDEGFVESNLMHAVSGRLACNLEGLVAARGQRVRLHLLGLGAELDMHTPQAHGNMLGMGVGAQGAHVAALGVHPGMRATVELNAHTPGQWMLECGVNDHWAAGMRALLTVSE